MSDSPKGSQLVIPMDPKSTATVGSAAVVAVEDDPALTAVVGVTEGGRVERGAQGRSAPQDRCNEQLQGVQEEQGKQPTDGRVPRESLWRIHQMGYSADWGDDDDNFCEASLFGFCYGEEDEAEADECAAGWSSAATLMEKLEIPDDVANLI